VPWGIRIEAQPAQKVGPLISADQPWEYRFAYTSLLKVDGKYRLYYEAEPPPGHPEIIGKALCIAESTDGKEWTKPHLGLVEFAGSKDNNIVFGGSLCRWGFQGDSVWVDPHAPPDERYKVVYMADVPLDAIEPPERGGPPRGVGREKSGKSAQSLLHAVSADGIHWKENPRPMLTHVRDSQNLVYYDQVLQRYVGYFRYKILDRRAVGRSETTDFNNWPPPDPILWPSALCAPSDDFYVNGRSMYPGTQDGHLMLTSVYLGETDSSTLRMASSPDGKLWNWISTGSLMDPGPDGAWDGGYFFVAGGVMVEMPDDRIALPFVTSRLPHKFPRFFKQGAVGLATWTKERLAALVADSEGEFYTPPMALQGNSLFLNFETRRAGSIRVEVVDSQGRTLADCDPLVGNQLKAAVTWKGESSLSPGKHGEVQLHFRLRAAKLYSFEVR